ncbi:hypothetical protein C8Q74DRAFT_1364214 [Fomes fomentarius]|nr:hypothetical protein C8Q74DRAFT_1364214 [Fomes fomentarius]
MNEVQCGGNAGPFELAKMLLNQVRSELDLLEEGRRRTLSLTSLQALDAVVCEAFTTVPRLINAYQPAHELPVEILSTIFHFVPDPYAVSEGRIGAPAFPSRCMNISQVAPLTSVCRRWRTIASGTASLWSTLYEKRHRSGRSYVNAPNPGPLYRHWIDRCTGGPLYAFLEEDVSSETLDLLTKEAPRVHDMQVIDRPLPTISEDKMQAILTAPLSNLEACKLFRIRNLPPLIHLFSGMCDRLQQLHLDDCSFFPSQPIPSLTHFYLFLHIYSVQQRPKKLNDLLNFLEGSPRLQKLHFFYNIPFTRDPIYLDEWHDRQVQLSELKLFILVDNSSTSVIMDTVLCPLASHIAIPESCTIRLGSMSGDQLRGTAASVSAHWTSTPATHMCIKSGRGPEHPYGSSSVAVANLESGNYTRFEVGHYYEPPPRAHGDLAGTLLEAPRTHLQETLSHVPLFSALREFYIHIGRYRQSWFAHERDSIFPQLPHLEVLGLSFEKTVRLQVLLSALQAGRDPQGPLHCCSLSMMLISCYTKTDVAYILQLAKSRAAAGRPLSPLLLDIEGKRTGKYEMREYDSEGVLLRILVDSEADVYRRRATESLGVPESW